MVYTDLTSTAMKIAVESHKNQYDKNGFPYIHHPLHIAEQMHSEYAVVVALLHDVLEDTDLTAEDLIQKGIPKNYVDTIVLLTRKPEQTYMEYINLLQSDKIACIVKRADLLHNMNPARNNVLYTSRMERYSKALSLIEEFIKKGDIK